MEVFYFYLETAVMQIVNKLIKKFIHFANKTFSKPFFSKSTTIKHFITCYIINYY